MRLWPTFTTIHQHRIASEQERAKGEAHTPRNILIVEFSVRAAYPLEPLCPLPGADLLIINYSNHQVLPTPSSSPRGYYPVTFVVTFRRYDLFFLLQPHNFSKQKKNCNKCARRWRLVNYRLNFGSANRRIFIKTELVDKVGLIYYGE